MAAVLASAARAASRLGIHALLAVVVGLAVLLVPGFAATDNLTNVLTQSSALGLVAIGQTFVIIGGLIDLSAGQLLGLTVVLTCALTDGRSEWLVPVLAAMLAMGIAVGVGHGFLLNRLRIEPLILTFGSLSILQGLIFVYTDRSVGLAPPELVWLASGRLFGVPAAALALLAFALLAHVLLTRTRFGLRLFATGGDAESARRAGVDTDRVRLFAFVLSGLGAVLGGLLIAGRLGTGFPNAGQGFELDAIVAAVLGGASLAGGRGTIAGTLAAVLLLGVFSNVLNLLEVSAFVQTFIKGLIVVAAIVAMRGRSALSGSGHADRYRGRAAPAADKLP
jgi:ribose/xylose/arabinose/galactoside ABC-type transport system permease subunit